MYKEREKKRRDGAMVPIVMYVFFYIKILFKRKR
jgi:hypothetical protein